MNARDIPSCPSARRSTRQAVTLVELLVVMSISVVVLTVATGTLHRAFQADRRVREDFDLQRTAQRLSRQLRQDVHRALTARMTSEPAVEPSGQSRLVLDGGPDQRVEYRVAGYVVRRVEQAAGEPRRFDEFELPASCRIFFDVADEPPRVSMDIWRTAQVTRLDANTQTSSSQEIGRQLVARVEAAVARYQLVGSRNHANP
jgi:prepilin-type N-terminal cleavage/methylation domain-containing protein